jgi:signal transduction histidine kinase
MRSLLLITVVLLASVPPLLGVVAWLAIGHVQHATEDRAVAAAGRYLAAGSGRWDTSGWQQQATVYFRSLDVEVAVTATPGAATTSDTGKPVTATVFATPGLAANGANKAELGTTMDGHQVHLPGTAQLSLAAVVFTRHPNPSTRLLGTSVAAGCGLIATLSAILWLFGRWVLSPLGGLSRAVEKVAGGDLSIRAPDSRAREIAKIGAAMVGMSRALGQAHDRGQQQDRERRFLTTAIAHDLRTPLFTLRGCLEALQRGLPGRDYLSMASQKAALLESLIGDLFAYSQAEYTGTIPQRKPTDFGPFLGDVLDEFEQRAAAKDIQLSISGPAEPVFVAIDRRLITRALNNVIDNALRHARPGGEVWVHWQPTGGQVEFEIGDNGEGFAANTCRMYSSRSTEARRQAADRQAAPGSASPSHSA